MSNKETLPPRPPGEGRQPIPVRVLTFPRPTDLPGKSGASSVTASTDSVANRWELAFLPWLRSYRVTYYPPGEGPRVKYIPESWAAWEALEVPAPAE